MSDLSRFEIELVGGRFDGVVGTVGPEVRETGFLVMVECPEHGVGAYCDCGDALWYGYELEPDGRTAVPAGRRRRRGDEYFAEEGPERG